MRGFEGRFSPTVIPEKFGQAVHQRTLAAVGHRHPGRFQTGFLWDNRTGQQCPRTLCGHPWGLPRRLALATANLSFPAANVWLRRTYLPEGRWLASSLKPKRHSCTGAMFERELLVWLEQVDKPSGRQCWHYLGHMTGYLKPLRWPRVAKIAPLKNAHIILYIYF